MVAIFCKLLLSGQQPVINGDGKQTRDFVHVNDVVRANLLALEHGENAIYNVGTGIETDINKIFRELNNGTGMNKPEKHVPAKQGEQVRSVLSYAKIQKELGWEPQIDLRSGLLETIKFFMEKQSVQV